MALPTRAVNEASRNDGLTNMPFSDYDIVDLNNGAYPYLLPDVDWFKEALRSHGTQDAVTVSFRGGSERVAYYSMLDYSNEQGILGPVNLNEKYSTQLRRNVFNASNKIDVRLTPTTDLSANLTANIAQFVRPGGPMWGALFDLLYELPPTAMPVYAEDGTWGGNPLYTTDDVSSNPVAQIANRGYISNHSRRLAVDGTLSQDLGILLKGLSADIRVGFDNMAEFADRRQIPGFLYTTYTWTRNPTTYEPVNINAQINGQEDIINTGSGFNDQWRHALMQGKLNYFFHKDVHSLHASAGYYQEKFVGTERYNTFLHQSMFGHVHYSYDQRYVADLALSYSGSNYLAPGDYFRFYPAISGAWIVSNESFMRGSQIDFLKARASFGLSGNDLITQNLFWQDFNQGGGYPFRDASDTNIAGRLEQQLATEKVEPECSYTGNFGIDFSIWKKLSGSLDLFYSHRTNIMAESGNTTSNMLGVTAPIICTGIVDNRGFETGLKWNDRVDEISYTIGAQFSYVRNKIINREEQFRLWSDTKRTGRRVGQQFGLKTDGFFQNGNEVNAATPQAWGELHPGDVRYIDHNGDGIIDSEDEQPIASPTGYPGIYFSLNLGVEWKGLGFSALVQGAAEYGVNLNTTGLYRGLVDNTTISQYMYDNSWSGERSTPAIYPRLTTLRNDNNFRINDIWMKENPFVKLRHVQIYYRLPQQLANKARLTDVTIFLNGSNLFCIDKLEVSDAEFIGANYPLMTTCTLGVNFKF